MPSNQWAVLQGRWPLLCLHIRNWLPLLPLSEPHKICKITEQDVYYNRPPTTWGTYQHWSKTLMAWFLGKLLPSLGIKYILLFSNMYASQLLPSRTFQITTIRHRLEWNMLGAVLRVEQTILPANYRTSQNSDTSLNYPICQAIIGKLPTPNSSFWAHWSCLQITEKVQRGHS